VRQISELIDQHPHRIVLVCDNHKALAARLVASADIEGLRFLPRESAIVVETRTPDAFYAGLPALALEDGAIIREVYSEDDNLEAVFKYLVSK
jgi:ABC-2 type transport system ATP-binding protein